MLFFACLVPFFLLFDVRLAIGRKRSSVCTERQKVETRKTCVRQTKFLPVFFIPDLRSHGRESRVGRELREQKKAASLAGKKLKFLLSWSQRYAALLEACIPELEMEFCEYSVFVSWPCVMISFVSFLVANTRTCKSGCFFVWFNNFFVHQKKAAPIHQFSMWSQQIFRTRNLLLRRSSGPAILCTL